MSTPLNNKPLIAEMEADDTFLIVTDTGENRRIKKSDLNLDELSGITDAYLNDVGELILVIGDGGGEEEREQEVAVQDIRMYVNVVRDLGTFSFSVSDETPADVPAVTPGSIVIHAVRDLGTYTTTAIDAIDDTVAVTDITMEVSA